MSAVPAADAPDLFAAARHCLDARDPDAKVALTHAYARRFRDGTLPLRRAAVPLAEVVEEVGAELAPAAGAGVARRTAPGVACAIFHWHDADHA